MPEWLIGLLSTAGAAVIGLIVADVYGFIKKNSKKYQEARKAARQAEMREVMQSEVGTLKTDLVNIKDGIQAELKHDIRNACRRCIQQGYKTEDDLEEVTSMHDKYERLGSNGVTNALYDEFIKLPLVSNDYKKPAPAKKKTAPKKA